MNTQIVFVPFMARDRFADAVGVTEDTLEGWVRNGYVKTYKIGTRSLIDLRQWVGHSQSLGEGFAVHGHRGGK